jgi:hypothetical protein
MKTVHKYVIPYGADGLLLKLTSGYRLLKSEYQLFGKSVCCWVEVPTDPRLAKQSVHLRLFSSGDGIPRDYVYVDTAINSMEPEAWHLYELRVVEQQEVA